MSGKTYVTKEFQLHFIVKSVTLKNVIDLNFMG